MKLSLCVFAAITASSSAFAPSTFTRNFNSVRLSSSDDAAEYLQDYMVKSQETKLILQKEIEALKKEIADIKGNPTTALAAAPSSSGSLTSSTFPATNRELQQKLLEYQTFIAKYIVDASAEKARAVKEAEVKTAAKYELLLAGGGPATAAPQLPTMDEQKTLFDIRNEMVATQGKASRWSTKEVEKAAGMAASSAGKGAAFSAAKKSVPAAPEKEVVVTEEIKNADHGMRSDGGVGGPSLAERVNFGAELVTK